MINSEQLRQLIIKPVLSRLQCYSLAAEELLIFTCAAESLGGFYLQQVNGPALGIYQMEPKTHMDIWANYLTYKPRLVQLLQLNLNVNPIPLAEKLIHDLFYATAMTRIHYLRFKDKLPSHEDIEGLWNYYKVYYNTALGKAKKTDAIKKYKNFIQLQA